MRTASKTPEQALVAAEAALEAAQGELVALTGKRATLPAAGRAAGEGHASAFRTGTSMEERLAKAESDLAFVRGEIGKAKANPAPAARPPTPATPKAAAPPLAPKSGPALVTAPNTPAGPLTHEQKVAAAFEKAQAIKDPLKRAYAFADARRLMQENS
jgi:hypothetical protein